MIIATRLLFWADAFTVNTKLILVRPEHKDNRALLAHERQHQLQMQQLGVYYFTWKYLTDRQFRQAMEVEAYKISIACGENKAFCARYLSERYWLGINFDEAMALL